MAKWTFYMETYGCKVNQYESQVLREAWQKLGGSQSANAETANFIIINSCAITSRAERDARNAVYRLRRIAPEAKIILCGCAANLFTQFKARKNANWSKPDICLDPGQKHLLLQGPKYLEGMREPFPTGKLHSYGRARAIVKIQDGCTQNCAYCIVPQLRPVLKSAKPELVLNECRALMANGHGEIVLSGINLRQYGIDDSSCGDFWDLLAMLDRELAPDFKDSSRLRISSLEPGQLTEKALETIANCQMLCPHIHLSLQHASPDILKAMNRSHYKVDKILDFTGKLRKIWPLYAIGADIIAGFPGEKEEDFQVLLEFISELGLTYAHVFPYSARPGTKAAKYEEQLNLASKKERAALIRKEVEKSRSKFWQSLLKLGQFHICPEAYDEHGMSKGMNEFYVACWLEQGTFGNKGLLAVKPHAIFEKGILVKAL